MKLRKNGKIKFSSHYKYWEFYAYMVEHEPSWSWLSLEYATCKEMAIGFRRYKTNKARHERPNSRFSQIYQYLKRRENENASN